MNIKDKLNNLVEALNGMVNRMPEEVAMSAAEETVEAPQEAAPEVQANTQSEEVPAWAQQLIADQQELKDWVDSVEVEEVVTEEPIYEAEPAVAEEPKAETVDKAEYDKLKADLDKLKADTEKKASEQDFKHDPEAQVRNTETNHRVDGGYEGPYDPQKAVFATLKKYGVK